VAAGRSEEWRVRSEEWRSGGEQMNKEQRIEKEEGKAKKLLKGWIIEVCGMACVYLES
jgi:hypothetical protein